MFIKPDQTVEGAMARYKKMRVEYFTRVLQKSNLEKFKKSHQNKYEIKEVKPPRDGVAYSCAYKFLHHTDTSFCADIEQYWDKNGNCIGFMLDGVKHMFDKEKLIEHKAEKEDYVKDVKVGLDSDLSHDMMRNMSHRADDKVYVVEPSPKLEKYRDVMYVKFDRGVASLSRKGSSGRVVEKSVWFDTVKMYDEHGNLLFMRVVDDKLFEQYEVPEGSGLEKAGPEVQDIISAATHSLVLLKDGGRPFGFHPVRLDNVAQRYKDGQNRILSKVPENSELAKYLEQYPDAKVKPSRFGWVTELPKDKYSKQMILAQRVKIWSKDGKFMPMIKSAQKEM